MSEFKKYRRMSEAELRPYVPGENMSYVQIGPEDLKAGSPRVGDMIARNPKNHADVWLVAEAYFKENFAPVERRASIVFRDTGTGEPGPGGSYEVFLEGVRKHRDTMELPTAEFYAAQCFRIVIDALDRVGCRPLPKTPGKVS